MNDKRDKLKRLAQQAEAGNWEFRAFIKSQCEVSDEELDALVVQTADEVWAVVRCTSCARCCTELTPALDDADQERLAHRLEMTAEQLRKEYLVYDEMIEGGGWRMKKNPCPFLEGKRCSVYEDRPRECRGYPYLHGGGFSHRMMNVLSRADICPVVYEVIERLKSHFGFTRVDPQDVSGR